MHLKHFMKPLKIESEFLFLDRSIVNGMLMNKNNIVIQRADLSAWDYPNISYVQILSD